MLRAAIEKIEELTTPEDWQIAATCEALMVGYDAQWKVAQDLIEVLEVEGIYTAPLVNLKTGRNSRTYSIAGIIDKLVQDETGTVLFDHKTTSQPIDDPSSIYWRQLAIDTQASHYELLLLANGIEVDRIVWDVTRKPSIRPKKLAKAVIANIHDTAVYCGGLVSDETAAEVCNTGRENGELYKLRLIRDVIDNPSNYYARRSVTRSRDQLVEYCVELWDVAKSVRQAKREDQHFKNPGACYTYNTPCEFLGLCSGNDTPDSDRWEPKPKKHTELPDGVGGSSVLTNSRLQLFQTCRRKHYYKYELGIQRVDEERKEALYFGSLWHEALDAYWSPTTKGEKDGDFNEQQASGASISETQLAI